MHILNQFINTNTSLTEKHSFREFLKSFAISVEEQTGSKLDLTDFAAGTKDTSDIYLDLRTLQSLAFVAGYAVHSYIKLSKCESCLHVLTEPKTFEIEECTESKYVLISMLDRGSLKWPSDRVIDAIISLWKIFTKIEQQH